MKKLSTLIACTIASLTFAQEQSFLTNAFQQAKASIPISEKPSDHLGTFYIKMGVDDSEFPKDGEKLQPGAGVGYRAAFGHHAMDISAEGNHREVRNVAEERVANYSYTLPRVNYLFYATPNASSSLYAGAGLGIGGMKDTAVIPAVAEIQGEDGTVTTEAMAARNDIQEFHGIVPNVAAGYEFGRKAGWRTFIQLDVSQPAVAAVKEGAFPGPRASLSMGAGF